MRLKSVKIYGFKTFADRTEFTLDAGVVAIVGSNGCGKSNIVDAILWALGETSARSLRAQTGKDVVFSGSMHRKALGFAEVTLTFDNEDGALPIAAAEVSVTRRVTKSGESDYAINRRPCRLRDVAELLADSGLGRAGYAIVGQSEIDQALAASAQQRRAWIDEAAGVHRYRTRRHEALRRLSAAEDHLRRIDDVLHELDSQREPLARESEEALAYRKVTDSLTAVETGLLCQELADAHGKLDGLTERRRSLAAQRDGETAIAISADAEQHRLQSEAEALATKIEAARKLTEDARHAAHVSRTDIAIMTTKLESLSALESAIADEKGLGATRLEEAEGDLRSALDAKGLEQSRLDAATKAVSDSDVEAGVLTKALADAESQLRRATLAEEAFRSFEIEQGLFVVRRAELDRELDGISAGSSDLAEGLGEAEGKWADAVAEVERLELAVATIRESLAVASAASRDRGQAATEVRRDVAILEARRDGLQASIEQHDGLAAGARAVVIAASEGVLVGEYLPVGESLTVDPTYAVAIDTALGAAANDLIVADERLAKAAIAFLKAEQAGRATFQPLTLVRDPGTMGAIQRLAREPGVVGIASDLTACEDRVRPVVLSLLGRTLVVHDIDVALRLAKSTGFSKIVTLDGEVVFASGAVAGGRSASQAQGLVQRQSEFQSLIDDHDDALCRANALDADAVAAAVAAQELEGQLARAVGTHEVARRELADVEAWRRSLRDEAAATERSRQRLLAEVAGIEARAIAPPERLDLERATAAREQAWTAWAARSTVIEGLAGRLDEGRERLRCAIATSEECSRRLAGIREALSSAVRRSDGLGGERTRLNQALAARVIERDEADGLVVCHEAEETALEGTSQGIRVALVEFREKGSAASLAARAIETQLHEAEVSAARHDLKRGHALSRLLEDYGIDEADALARASCTRVPADAASVVHGLRRQLKLLGTVNLGAIEAYERLNTRFAELEAQRQDIGQGKSEIETTVRELDRLTRERFETTFALVRDAFAEVFSRAFDGGQAELSLVDSDGGLDAGVDIQVTLPGKKRQRLELLSGGERALSAVAFLFALLKVKPSPLVVLDEVDAPLDGRNVERFVEMLQEFATRSQFIVVTHNPVTIYGAEIWLGVTMSEPGVSALVPFRAPSEAASDRALSGAFLKG